MCCASSCAQGFLERTETAGRHRPEPCSTHLAHHRGQRDLAQLVGRDPVALEFGPLGNVGDIDFGFQFEMGEAMAHDAGPLFPLRLERRLLQRLGA